MTIPIVVTPSGSAGPIIVTPGPSNPTPISPIVITTGQGRPGEVGPTGPTGASGSTGPTGPAGADGGSFLWTQSVAAATWTITHPLNRRPSVVVVDSGGTIQVGIATYPDNSTVVLSFSATFSGTAHLN